ncbi:MAG TPA: tetratricopeptide repeat protein [Polyangia bacterium]|nr:tetratricopeptide repeat protein [Polyangia bacterium]
MNSGSGLILFLTMAADALPPLPPIAPVAPSSVVARPPVVAPAPVVAPSSPAPQPQAAAEPIRSDPVAAQRDLEAGLSKLRAGEIGDAVDLLKSAHAKDPASATIANDLGYALMKLGARREAETMYRAALDRDPRRALAYANLSELVAQSPERWQRQDEILALLKRAQGLLRDDARGRVVVALGAAGFEQSVGRLGDARRRLEEVLAQKPESALRKRALDQLSGIADQERAQNLADWPQPPADRSTDAALRGAETLLEQGRAAEALARATALCDSAPTATEPRFVRARVLDAMGRHDEATRDLMLLLQLRPSHAGGWRLLGTILATHGGVLEAERADEALRRALALEPSWGDLRALRQRVSERRAIVRQAPPPPPRRHPSRQSQALFEDAQRLASADTTDAARSALAAALADSPGFVEAAVLHFSLAGEVPAATVKALWDDGEALARLSAEIVRVRTDAATGDVVKPWLDRAVILGAAEARFGRALIRADEADSAGALADLTAYVASDVNPPHLAEARALRRTLEGPATGRGSTIALARELLLGDHAREAKRALGGACRSGMAAETLVELGRIEEYEGRPREALACHRLAAAAEKTDAVAARAALERIARIASALSPAEAMPLRPALEQALRADIPAAAWALARLDSDEQRWDEALALGDRFVRSAAPADPLRQEAARTLVTWRDTSGQQSATRGAQLRTLILAVAAVAILLMLALFVRRLRGRTVAAALARVPDLYPDAAAAIAEIRHDVLKHRTSGLGLLGESGTAREEIARALTEPTPTSQVVGEVYARLERAAAAAGVALRPIHREPVFGPLQRALARVEALIGRAGNSDSIAAIDRELREQHGPALAGLLELAPQTRLDPAEVSAWIRGITGGDGDMASSPKTVTPGLQLPTTDLDVPLTSQALYAILSNLVRNAAAAVGGVPEARVLVRVDQSRDAVGRRSVTFLVADSAPATVTLDEIDRREGQRGLGIVRDLVHRWGGHVVVRPEPPPFVKAIGATFPVAGSPEVGA